MAGRKKSRDGDDVGTPRSARTRRRPQREPQGDVVASANDPESPPGQGTSALDKLREAVGGDGPQAAAHRATVSGRTRLFDASVFADPSDAIDFIGNILEASTEYSMIGKSLDGTIQLWNEGARRLYG